MDQDLAQDLELRNSWNITWEKTSRHLCKQRLFLDETSKFQANKTKADKWDHMRQKFLYSVGNDQQEEETSKQMR